MQCLGRTVCPMGWLASVLFAFLRYASWASLTMTLPEIPIQKQLPETRDVLFSHLHFSWSVIHSEIVFTLYRTAIVTMLLSLLLIFNSLSLLKVPVVSCCKQACPAPRVICFFFSVEPKKLLLCGGGVVLWLVFFVSSLHSGWPLLKGTFVSLDFLRVITEGDGNLEHASGALSESIYVFPWAGASWINWGCLRMYCATGE